MRRDIVALADFEAGDGAGGDLGGPAQGDHRAGPAQRTGHALGQHGRRPLRTAGRRPEAILPGAIREHPLDQLFFAPLLAAEPLQHSLDRRVGGLDGVFIAEAVVPFLGGQIGFGQIFPPSRPLAQADVALGHDLVHARLRRLDHDVARLAAGRFQMLGADARSDDLVVTEANVLGVEGKGESHLGRGLPGMEAGRVGELPDGVAARASAPARGT